jgi:hypothetical protein
VLLAQHNSDIQQIPSYAVEDYKILDQRAPSAWV